MVMFTFVAWMKIFTSSSILEGDCSIAFLSSISARYQRRSLKRKWMMGLAGQGREHTGAGLYSLHIIIRHIVLNPFPIVITLLLRF